MAENNQNPTQNNQNQNNNNGQGAGGDAAANAKAIQDYMARLMNENAGLKDMVGRLSNRLTDTEQKQTESELEKLDEKQQLQVYKTAIQQFKDGATRQAAETQSFAAWQTATANAAGTLLKTVGLTVDEPGLYKGPFDVNWMPNFTRSVEQVLANKQKEASSKDRQDPNTNPANSANVGRSSTNTIPDVEWEKLDGYSTIQAALARGSKT